MGELAFVGYADVGRLNTVYEMYRWGGATYLRHRTKDYSKPRTWSGEHVEHARTLLGFMYFDGCLSLLTARACFAGTRLRSS